MNLNKIIKTCKLFVFLLLASCTVFQPEIEQPQQVEVQTNSDVKSYMLLNRNEIPVKLLSTYKPIDNITNCIVWHMENKFKLSSNFFKVSEYDNYAKSVALNNPYNGKEGLIFDVVPYRDYNLVILYPNGATYVSKAWLRVVDICK